MPSVKKLTAKRFQDVIDCHKRGDLEQTREGCREILRREPEHVEALSLLSVVEFETGNTQIALALLNRLIELCPDNPRYFSNRATVLQALGKTEKSIGQCLELIKQHPDRAASYVQLGDLYRDQQRLELAGRQYEKAMALQPGSATPLLKIGWLHMDKNRPQEALDFFQRAEALKPESRRVRLAMAHALSTLGRAQQSREILESLLSKSGGEDPEVMSRLAQTCAILGDKSKALGYGRAALKLKPDLYRNYAMIVGLERPTADSIEVREMRRLLKSAAVTDEQRLEIGFALGKALGDLGEYEQAFHCFELANSLRRRLHPENGGKLEAFQRNAEAYRNAYRLGVAEPTVLPPLQGEPIPIFLIGMPRSGSTLAEHVLTMHSGVDPAGEFSYFVNALDQWADEQGFADRHEACPLFAVAAPESLESVRRQYLSWLGFHRQAGRFVTDKMLYNFQFVGPVLQLFPNAPVIECVRSPMDSCWSIYRTSFAALHHYADDQKDIAEVYKIYREMMDFWRERYPDRIYRLRYEDVIADPNREIRKLLDFCGLEFEERCLTPSENPRPVRTASLSQVRKPFYSGAIGAWRPYADYLKPRMMATGVDRASYENRDSQN